jgi:transposase
MRNTNRRRFDSKFKSKVVIEALKEQKTLSALSKEFNLYPQQITDWKKKALSYLKELYTGIKRELKINASWKSYWKMDLKSNLIDISSKTRNIPIFKASHIS